MRFVQYISRFFTRMDSVVNVAMEWSRAFAELGYDVVLAHGTTDVWRDDLAPGIEEAYVTHAGVGKNLVPLSLGKVLRPGDVLIMHTDWRLGNLVAAAAARRKGVPYVIVPHGEYYPEQLQKVEHLAPARLAAERWLLRGSLAVHVFWPSEAPLVQSFAPGTRCIAAPTGVNLTDARWKGGGGYLSWIGRYVVDHKGLDILAGALATMDPERRPHIELRGFDQQGQLDELRRLVASLGVGPAMHLGGTVVGDEKARFLSEAEAYVHPSRWECHSVALLENLAIGVPSLVSTGSHCASALAAAGAALVADPDEASLADGLDRLAAADLHQLSGAALAFAEEQLRWDTNAKTFVDGVTRLLADR
ncbi:MAG: glycosyltransferase family 4 protein [Acidimicrobiales bacterium]|nr:glycosyltransferase family 4 protein [Acidimicrobiales bacterium]